jgi:5-methyltetrahydrofolate--homocysteine methyltransferase
MENSIDIKELITQRILVLDGAMGTMIQRHGLTEEEYRGARFRKHPYPLKGCNEVLSLTRHELISDIHREYLHAGADIIETNTFNATRISLSDFGMQEFTYEINAASARWARIVADEFTRLYPAQPRYVAGSIGPTGKTLSISPDVNNPAYRAISFNEMKDAYAEQVKGLMDGGVHMLLVETVFDTLNAKAALFAISEVFEKTERSVPVIVSLTISDASGRSLSGQTLEAFVSSVSHFPIFCIGLNCALGAAEMTPFLKRLREIVPCYISAYPNAGLPNENGGYDEKPEEMNRIVEGWLNEGLVNIIGGCCGTNPEHIKLLAASAKNSSPAPLPQIEPFATLAGLEPLYIRSDSNFIQVGERTNVAGSRKFARLIAEKKYEEALSVARHQVEAGAHIIDVNMDDGLLDAKHEMQIFLKMLSTEPSIARVPVMIDSSRWEVIEAGLQCLQGKSIVNSISLKEGEKVFLERASLVKRYGAAVVVMAFDEKGQATDYQRKIDVCKRAYDLLTGTLDFNPCDIYFDPNVLTIATGIEEHDHFAVEFIRAVEWIRANLPGAGCSGGISNLSFSFRGNNQVRAALHTVFLHHAIKAGLTMGIVNAAELPPYSGIDPQLRALAEEVIMATRPDAATDLIRLAAGFSDKSATTESIPAWRNDTLEQRIIQSVISGIPDYLNEDIAEYLSEKPDALGMIEGPLLNAMNIVGDEFGQGKMFLPQVVKSARVMKRAVDIVLPQLHSNPASSASSSVRPKILLATVKGDVHDIGKNIAALVLSCNNMEVIDLGVMVSAEEIVSKAIREKADAVGLSGLITPSLHEMIHVAKEMKHAGLKIPLIIGGATTSEKHTALKIAPEYDGPVIHVRDAGKAVVQIKAALSPNADTHQQENQKNQQDYRELHQQKVSPHKLISFEEACKRPFPLNWTNYHFPIPHFEGVKQIKLNKIDVLYPLIDWSQFFYAWDIPGKYPELFSNPEKGEQAKRLYDDAQLILEEIKADSTISPLAMMGIFPANAEKECIRIFRDDTRKATVSVLHFLRSQQIRDDQEYFACLSDFVAPTGYPDHIGLFALTAGDGFSLKAAAQRDEYRSFMILTLADRIAEAFSEYLHLLVRSDYWGYEEAKTVVTDELFRGRYQGIRPAPGYPSCPDHSEKATIFRLLGVEANTEIRLTENYAMSPVASVCGYYFSHPLSRHFAVGPIGEDQMKVYSALKNMPADRLINFTS